MTSESKANVPGFQGSETSSAEVVFYTQRGDPVVFVGASTERDSKIEVLGRKAYDIQPSLIAVSTSKAMGAPSGNWQVTLKVSNKLESFFNRVLDDDWVDIVFTRHGRRWHVMRGLVDQVREVKGVNASGATTKVYNISGRDFGKIFEQTPIWFSVYSDEAITGGAALKVFGGQTNIQGDPATVVQGYLLGFLQELAGTGRALWSPPPSMPNIGDTFGDSVLFDSTGFENVPARTAINPSYMMPQGMVWEMAQQWSDPIFNELWVDTLPADYDINPESESDIGDTDMVIRFRERPFPTIETSTPNGQDHPWFKDLPLLTIPRQAIVAADVGRSGLERYNAFFMSPQIAQETIRSGSIDLYEPLWNPDDILRHGLRRFDVVSKYTTPNADLLTLSSEQRIRCRDWYCINPYLLNGTLELAIGMPHIHVGTKVRIPGSASPDQDETYYVEQVSHQWQLQSGIRTSLGVTRGWVGTDSSYLDALGLIAGNYVVATRKTVEG